MAAALGREVSVEDIFCAVKKDHDPAGLLTRDELADATISLLRVLSHTEVSHAQAEKLTQRALEEAGAGQDGIYLDEFERAVRLPIQQDRDATRFPRALLVAVLPVLYGVSTRIGFVTLPMHAAASGLSLLQIGLVLGLFQLQRALANWAIVKRGSSAALPLVSLALCGFAFSVVWPDHWLSCWVYTLTGLGEIIVSLQHEMLLLPCMAANPASLKKQFAWVCLGACIAFVAGSALMTFIGFHASCLLGAFTSFLTLSLGAILCWVQRRRTSFSPYIDFPPDAFALRPFALGVGSLIAMSHVAVPCDEDMPTTVAAMISKVESLLAMSLDRVPLDKSVIECCVSNIMSGRDADDHWRYVQDDDANLVSGCLQRFRNTPICCGQASSRMTGPQMEAQQAPRIVYPFLLSQVFIAMCIGTFLGTGGLYYAQTYGVSAFVFGVSMGLGELLGMCTSHAALLQELQKRPDSAPKDALPSASINLLLAVMVAITIVMLLFSGMTHVAGAVLFQLSFQVLNDVWTYVVNDIVHHLSPVSLYRRLQGQGQMYRRVGNALAGLIGPILLQVYPPLPFIVAALMLLLWTVMLAIFVALHRDRRQCCYPQTPASARTAAASLPTSAALALSRALSALESWYKDTVPSHAEEETWKTNGQQAAQQRSQAASHVAQLHLLLPKGCWPQGSLLQQPSPEPCPPVI